MIFLETMTIPSSDLTNSLEPVSKSPEEDNEAGEPHKAQEILSVVLPTNKDTGLPLGPGKAVGTHSEAFSGGAYSR